MRLSTEDLSNKISDIERQLVELKTNQAMQNDSFTLYSYTSGDLIWSGSGVRRYTAKFRSFESNEGRVLCQFFLVDPNAIQTYAYCMCSLNDPLTTNFVISPSASLPSSQTFRNMAYLLCIANCEGELSLSYTTASY